MTDEVLHPLRRIRRKQGLSQINLGVLSGVDTATISRIEAGQPVLWGGSLVALARALGVPTRELVNDGQASDRALDGSPRDDGARVVAARWLGLDLNDPATPELLNAAKRFVTDLREQVAA